MAVLSRVMLVRHVRRGADDLNTELGMNFRHKNLVEKAGKLATTDGLNTSMTMS